MPFFLTHENLLVYQVKNGDKKGIRYRRLNIFRTAYQLMLMVGDQKGSVKSYFKIESALS